MKIWAWLKHLKGQIRAHFFLWQELITAERKHVLFHVCDETKVTPSQNWISHFPQSCLIECWTYGLLSVLKCNCVKSENIALSHCNRHPELIFLTQLSCAEIQWRLKDSDHEEFLWFNISFKLNFDVELKINI